MASPAPPSPPASSPPAGSPPPGSPWSIRVVTIAGIPVRLHFTTLLVLTYLALVDFRNGGGFRWPGFLIVLFLCLLAHEFGHALTARKFGVKTRDITLYPIGGLAMLEGKLKPKEEFWVAIAGPLVNFVIAGALALTMPFFGEWVTMRGGEIRGVPFVPALIAANLTLALFNLIPAFPMDGGRILRAGLAMRMPEEKATRIAANIGQSLAIVAGIAALFHGEVALMLVAFFVFIGAGAESASATQTALVDGHVLRDAMQTRFRTISSGATLDDAARMLLEGSQHDFPVVAGDDVLGVLTRQNLVRGLASEGPTAYVAGFTNREPCTGHPNLPLGQALELMPPDENSPILVMEEGRLLGMVTRENLGEFLTLQNVRRMHAT